MLHLTLQRLATTILDQDGSPISNGVLLPVLTGVIGDTAFWKVQAKDNFSAGEKTSRIYY